MDQDATQQEAHFNTALIQLAFNKTFPVLQCGDLEPTHHTPLFLFNIIVSQSLHQQPVEL